MNGFRNRSEYVRINIRPVTQALASARLPSSLGPQGAGLVPAAVRQSRCVIEQFGRQHLAQVASLFLKGDGRREADLGAIYTEILPVVGGPGGSAKSAAW